MATLFRQYFFILCLVFLAVQCNIVSGETETIRLPQNISVEVCSEIHLCQNLGCGTHWNKNSACQCDWACELFDDCCVDFSDACPGETVPRAMIDLERSSFECMTKRVKGQSGNAMTNHYWMLSHCPGVEDPSHTQQILQQNCETPTSERPVTLIPVTDARGVTYRNAYCALCNGQPANKLVAWTLNATCLQSVIVRLQNTNQTTFMRIVLNDCNHFFQLPMASSNDSVMRRPCIPSLVRDCGSHGSNTEACETFTAVVRSTQSRSVYRNPACYAQCELFDGSHTLTCPTLSSYISGQYALVKPNQLNPTTEITITGTQTTERPGTVDPSPIINASLPPLADDDEPVIAYGHGLYFDVHSVVHKSYAVIQHGLESLSIILDFDDGDSDDQATMCADGDLFDSTTQECLSPSCTHGFIFMTSEGRCEPSSSLAHVPDTASGSFHCLNRHYHGRSNFSLQITVETENPTGRNISTPPDESSLSVTEQCLQDSLALHVIDDGRQEMTASVLTLLTNSSEIIFEIALQRNEERPTSSDTEINDGDFWQRQVDSVVDDIEKWLFASSATGGRSCGVKAVQIVQKCEGGELNDSSPTDNCQEHLWLPLDENTTTSTDNQTILIFDEDSQSWFNASSYSLRIAFNQEESRPVRSNIEIGLCQGSAINFTCPTVDLHESQFSKADDTDNLDSYPNGSLVFIQTGQILTRDEFIRTDEGRIKVCSSVLPSTADRSFFSFNYAQAVVSTVGLSISVVAGTLTLITYVAFPSLHSRTRKAIMGMVASLILAQLLLLTSGQAVSNKIACTAVAVAGHFLWMASLTWTNVFAFLLWHTFVGSKPAASGGQVLFKSKTNLLGIAYALGIPFAVVIPCLIIHFCSCTKVAHIYSTENACWITPGLVNLVAFGVPMALFLVINIALFARTVFAIRSSRRRSEKQLRKKPEQKLKRTRKELMIYIRIASLMGFTWVFGFISSAFPKVQALAYLFILLISLQGFFIFLSFTFNVQVKRLWQKKLSPVGSSILSKTSQATSKLSKFSATASSVSAGVAASESMEMSSNPTSETPTTSDGGHQGQSKQAGRFKATLRGIWAKKRGDSSEGGCQSEQDEATTNFNDDTVKADVHNNIQVKAAMLKARLSGIWARHLSPSQQDPKSKGAESKNQFGDDITRKSDVDTHIGIPHGKALLPKLQSPQHSKDGQDLGGIRNRGIVEDLEIQFRPKAVPPIPPPKLQHQNDDVPTMERNQGTASSKEDSRGISRSEVRTYRMPLPPIPTPRQQQQAEGLPDAQEVGPQGSWSGLTAKPLPPVPQSRPQLQDMSASPKDDQDVFGSKGPSPERPPPPPKPHMPTRDPLSQGNHKEASQVSSPGTASSQDILESRGPSCEKPVPPPRPNLQKTGHQGGHENLVTSPPCLASQDIPDQDQHPSHKPNLPPKPTMG